MSEPTVSAMAGTTCMALAPLPITATCLPASSTEGSHCEVWRTGPSKSRRPGIAGHLGVVKDD